MLGIVSVFNAVNSILNYYCYYYVFSFMQDIGLFPSTVHVNCMYHLA